MPSPFQLTAKVGLLSAAILASNAQAVSLGAFGDTEFTYKGYVKFDTIVSSYDSGMGRYVGLNIANGAVLDENGSLDAIDSTAYYLSYRHFWNDKWRSTLSYSAIEVDNDTDLTGTGVSKRSESTRVNLMYSPMKRLSLGGELSFANREVESGDDGSMTRLQFSAKLGF